MNTLDDQIRKQQSIYSPGSKNPIKPLLGGLVSQFVHDGDKWFPSSPVHKWNEAKDPNTSPQKREEVMMTLGMDVAGMMGGVKPKQSINYGRYFEVQPDDVTLINKLSDMQNMKEVTPTNTGEWSDTVRGLAQTYLDAPRNLKKFSDEELLNALREKALEDQISMLSKPAQPQKRLRNALP
jgi:uncharacterized protein YhjY with autotransporter beta-barrel domain